MKRYIRSTTEYSQYKFCPGMIWYRDGHRFLVKARSGSKMTVLETWTAEDDWTDCKELNRYTIKKFDSGEEYGVPEGYDDNPLFRIACSAVSNLSDFVNEPFDDVSEDEFEEYTPSATQGDYSPSHPWDAPGMSVHDFI